MTNHIIAKNNDEMKLQVGIGVLINTSNIYSLTESSKLYQSMNNGTDYNYPGFTPEQADAYKNLTNPMKRALIISNIFGALEYGITGRILWNYLIGELDIILLPFDGSYNGRMDLVITPLVGLRYPWMLMPYLIVGMTLTFSFYPGELDTIESWKSRSAATNNFVFRPGLIVRLGADFKVSNFSIGLYYQYTIKDFDEFTLWYNELIDYGYSPTEAGGKIFGSQSRFGVAINMYFNFNYMNQ